MSKHKFQLLIALFYITLGLAILPDQGQAHGVRGLISTTETICATAGYDDGEPMSYSEVEIYAPDSELPFQSGRTDRNGVFCFKADSPGDWQLTINDGMGHRVHLKTTVSQDMALVQGKAAHEPNAQFMSKAGGVVTGVALIFGLSGCLAWWRSRKKNGKTLG
jgi:nickel transport protein